MSHGLRGRLRQAASFGFGLLVCSGTLGCMDDKKLPSSTKPPTPGLPGTPPVNGLGNAPRPGQPGQPNQWNVNGVPTNGAGNVNMTQRGPNAGGANPNNFGTMGTPTTPGYGPAPGYGQPAGYNTAPNNSVIPSVAPTPTSSVPSPKSVAMANTSSARGQGPELPAMTDLGGPIPPAQPYGTVPSVSPSGYQPPVAPPSPAAPVAPPYPVR